MADVSVDLKVDRSLLDSHFDGYKLSLESLPTYRVTLSAGIDEVKLTDAQYSYQHVKAFGIHNHLVHDPWNPDTVYFVDSAWSVHAFTVHLETSFDRPEQVFEIPESSNRRLRPGRHHATLSFPGPSQAVLADGAGTLYIIDTGNRKEAQKWKVSLSETVLGEGKPFTLLYSTLHSDNETHRLDCLLLHVDPADTGSNAGSSAENGTDTRHDAHTTPFITVLEWLTYNSVDHVAWTLERTRRLTGTRSPDFTALQQGGRALLVAADRPFTMVYDSFKPVEVVREEPAKEERPPPAYTWLQNPEEVSVQFPMKPGVTQVDLGIRISSNDLHVGVQDVTLLDGELHAVVDVDGSTWTLSDGILEVTLAKRDATTWPTVVIGDSRGELVIDQNEVKIIQERLAHLTSEQPGADPEEDCKPAYNAQQLEDCDMYPDESATMMRIDGETHTATHQVHLGSNQWLFNMRSAPEAAPSICFRHDVDGLVWQPLPEDQTQPRVSPWTHTATFNALGYVQASKQNKKFTGCASDYSYAFIADCMRHIYIYRQPTATLSPLRNRKTGRHVGAIAKQQVVSLDSSDDIYGIVATPQRLYVIAGKTLYVIKVAIDINDGPSISDIGGRPTRSSLEATRLGSDKNS